MTAQELFRELIPVMALVASIELGVAFLIRGQKESGL